MRWVLVMLLGLYGCASPQQPGSKIDNPSRYIGCFEFGSGFRIITMQDAVKLGTENKGRRASYLKDKHGPFILVRPPFRIAADGGKLAVADAPGEGTLIRLGEYQGVLLATVVDTDGADHIGTKQACSA